MKTIILVLLVLVGGSCYGQQLPRAYNIADMPKCLTESDISRIVDEVIRRLGERNRLDALAAISDTTYPPETLWTDTQTGYLKQLDIKSLDMVIDTVEIDIDTTGFEQRNELQHKNRGLFFLGCNDEVLTSYPTQYKGCDLPSHMDTVLVWYPIVDTTYTTDTLYRLTPGQIERLK